MTSQSSAAHEGDVSNTVATLYSTCNRLPLIKSPALRVPPPVTLPPTLHPLPSNIQEYFVYPFSLEKYVLDAAAQREKSRKEELQRRAPGWTQGGVLEPTKRTASLSAEGVDEIDEIGAMLDQLGSR